MKKLIVLVLILLPLLTACQKSLNVTVSNTLATDRNNEMVEMSLEQISKKLTLNEGESFIVENEKGEEIPYQITHDQKVIFQATVKAEGTASFCIHRGTPQTYATKACGKIYPERMDDLAWENDVIGARAYGPALQKRGERGFGYDLFAKRGTTEPVLEDMYKKECNKESWAKFRELNKTDRKAAQEWRRAITYHCDRGHGMDCYAVGPTLGAGIAALLNGEEIVYPWCYDKCEILDNGPLRFTARLVFTPLTYKESEVIETRVISLDAGSHMNRTHISYKGLNESAPIVSGIVLHAGSDNYKLNTEKGFITYQDPTTGPDQGELYLGHVHPETVKDTRAAYFSEEESKTRNNAKGHVLAENVYNPATGFLYYWGFGWNRGDVKDYATWNTYIADFAERIKAPLVVSFN